MASSGKSGRYHHGDLRAALIDTAVELIGERGLRGFSLAEASRRLGVAVSAPYAHFADREELLVAVSVRGYQLFAAQLDAEAGPGLLPAARLAALTRAYVRFAGANRALFEVLYDAGLDSQEHPEIKAASKPVEAAFLSSAGAVAPAGDQVRDLVTALEAAARGHALFLLDGHFGEGEAAVAEAAERAARATCALVASRHLLSADPSADPSADLSAEPSADPSADPSGEPSAQPAAAARERTA